MILFSPVHTGDQRLDNMQAQLRTAIRGIGLKEILDGVLTETQALTTSYQDIAHGLGRAPQGWIAVSPDAAATIFQDPTVSNNPDPTHFIRIRGSAAVNCKFWVF